MKKYTKAFATFFIIFVAYSQKSYCVEHTQWRMQETEKNISLFSRKIKHSEFIQVKAIVTINAAIESVETYFHSGYKCWQWQRRCKKTQVLQKISNNEEISHVIIDMPWPIEDRDLVLHTKLEKRAKSNSIVIELISQPNFYPKIKNYIRAHSKIRYELQSTSANSTLLIIEMHTEFGGSVMPSLINKKLINELKVDIKQLINLAETNNNK